MSFEGMTIGEDVEGSGRGLFEGSLGIFQ